jgi:hypothetical protein
MVCQPSTRRILTWPEVIRAQNDIAAVSGQGNTACVVEAAI